MVDSKYDFPDIDFGGGRGPQMKPDIMVKLKVMGVKKDPAKDSKNLQFGFRLSPVDADDVVAKVSGFYYVQLPWDNPEVAGHKLAADSKEFAVKKCADLARTFAFDESPPLPGRKGEDGKYVQPNGEAVTKDQWDAYNKEKSAFVSRKIKSWYANPEQLVGQTCYGATKANKNDESRTEISFLTAQPGARTVYLTDFMK